MPEDILARLRSGVAAIWVNPKRTARTGVGLEARQREMAVVRMRWERFAPSLAKAFALPDFDGRIGSPLLSYPKLPAGVTRLYVKADHSLPLTGSVKARGGVYELLCILERIALREGLVMSGSSYEAMTSREARVALAKHTVVVASTGNLGFSIGLVARAFGLNAEIHMSADAKAWKKERLRALGATVVEHAGDYTSTVASARASAGQRRHTHFIDDEGSRELFMGYTGAAAELAQQLRAADVVVSAEQPLFVYLPCGVGGAPGGITYGLKAHFGQNVVCVFAEPTASACVLVAQALGGGRPVSVYDVGLDNRTDADGLAVARASALVLDTVGDEIDVAVAVPDATMARSVRSAWRDAGLRLELSAAAGFAAFDELRSAVQSEPARLPEASVLRLFGSGVHVVWTTGGSLIPDQEFASLLEERP